MLKSQDTTKGFRWKARKSNNFDRKNVLSKKTQDHEKPCPDGKSDSLDKHLSLGFASYGPYFWSGRLWEERLLDDRIWCGLLDDHLKDDQIRIRPVGYQRISNFTKRKKMPRIFPKFDGLLIRFDALFSHASTHESQMSRRDYQLSESECHREPSFGTCPNYYW